MNSIYNICFRFCCYYLLKPVLKKIIYTDISLNMFLVTQYPRHIFSAHQSYTTVAIAFCWFIFTAVLLCCSTEYMLPVCAQKHSMYI